ncbi:MAG: hypothetical protein E7529_00195 [Ruminococcaceae bacterium]|nr:hypothetical protein [Oscillospiraceae bacterium]
MSDKKLYILTYEHGGYVLWKNEVKPRLKKLFEWLEKYPTLKIGLDYESFTFDEFSKEDPEVVELIGELLGKYPDRVGLGATTYGQPLALTISEESNARQLLYAVRTNLAYFGKTPNVYAISEFALHNQTPQLISKCGYDAAILRSHVMGYGYPRTFDCAWGKWIGKDGTSIPAVPTYEKQGRGFNCTTVDNWIFSRWPVDSELYSPEDFAEMFQKHEPLLASRYDDLTQPVESVIAHTVKKENCQYVLLEEIPEIYGEADEELPTTDNDFHVQMPWGYCGNEIFNGCRQGEVEAVQGEKLNALSVMLGGKSLQEKSEYAWKYILAAEHHDVTICGLLDLSRRFIPTSLEASKAVKEESLKFIASKFAHKDYESLLVINTHSFPVDEWVQVDVEKEYCAFDGHKEIESEIVIDKNKKVLRAHIQLPPFTAKSYILKEVVNSSKLPFCWSEKEGVLTTPNYEIKLVTDGISYIKDIKSGKILCDNGNGVLFTGFVDDEEYSSNGVWEVKTSACSATAIQKGKIGSIPYEVQMQFNGNSKRIDFKTKFDVQGQKVGRTDITHGKPVPLTVNGHHHEDKICFVINPCLSKDRKMFRDLPYSISEWNGALRKTEEYWYPDDKIILDIDVTPEESFNSTTYYHGIYWVSLKDKQNGLGIFNKGCMGAAVSGNKVHIPLIYSNEYLCGDRILNGVFENEFALFPFESELSEAELHKKALSYAYAPNAMALPIGNGSMTECSFANINTDNKNVILTALYPEDNHILARFCNYSDTEEKIELNMNIGKTTFETDLLGKETNEIIDNKLVFKPWEIKTVKIEK